MTLRFRKPAYRPTSVPMPEDLYAVTTDAAQHPAPEDARAHLRNALQILRWVNPMTQGAQELNVMILAAEARVIKALAQLEGTAVPQADGAGE